MVQSIQCFKRYTPHLPPALAAAWQLRWDLGPCQGDAAGDEDSSMKTKEHIEMTLLKWSKWPRNMGCLLFMLIWFKLISITNKIELINSTVCFPIILWHNMATKIGKNHDTLPARSTTRIWQVTHRGCGCYQLGFFENRSPWIWLILDSLSTNWSQFSKNHIISYNKW